MKTIKLLYIVPFLFMVTEMVGCEEKSIDNNVSLDKKLISELSNKALDTLLIDSKKYVLAAELWRDFQPISPSGGKALISINWLICTDSVKIPNNIDLIKQYVIYEDFIWSPNYENKVIFDEPEFKIKKISRNGPKWEPKIYVDVISKIHDSNTNKDYFLKLNNVHIDRED
jgi:hypothetical protein